MDKLEFMFRGKKVTARMEVKPAHFGPATDTVHANKTAEIFVFRKTDGIWQQHYGKEHGEMKDAIVRALDEKLEG